MIASRFVAGAAGMLTLGTLWACNPFAPERLTAVVGTVTADGAPAQGWSVTLRSSLPDPESYGRAYEPRDDETVIVDARGRFELFTWVRAGSCGRASLMARAGPQSLAVARKGIGTRCGPQAPVDVEVTTLPVDVSGVVTLRGVPFSGATVQARVIGELPNPTVASAPTGPDGRYRIATTVSAVDCERVRVSAWFPDSLRLRVGPTGPTYETVGCGVFERDLDHAFR